jgi:ribosomal-protein-alanine N-acetyltransferase
MNEWIFDTERLYIRRFTALDEDNFFAVNGDPEVMKYIRSIKTRNECREFLQETIRGYAISPHTGRWAMHEKNTQKFVGTFAVIPLHNSNDLQIGYALLKDFRGRGYATESLRTGIRYVFSVLDLPRIMALTDSSNLPSQKVLLKTGFVKKSVLMDKETELFLYELVRPE